MSHSVNSRYSFYGKPPFSEVLVLGIQHLLAMFIGNIVPILIVGPIAGITDPALKTLLVQGALLSSVIATLIQLYPIMLGKHVRIGAGLPVIIGVSSGFMAVNISIAKAYGLSGLMGAQIIGSLITIPIGFIMPKIHRFFPPIVTGTIILSIGLSLFTIGIRDMAGGANAPDFASAQNLGLGFFVLATVVALNQFTKGIFSMAAIFFAVIIGYFVALLMGKVDLTPVVTAGWFAFPELFKVGITFHADAIVAMSIMYLITALQTLGDLTAISVGGMNKELASDELSGGIIGNGVGSLISVALNSLPTATFSQNVGVLVLTKISSRIVMAVSVLILGIAGFIPKIAAVISSIPKPVLGGATTLVFSLISMTGIKLLAQEDLSKSRNTIIVGLSLALGTGVTQVSGLLDNVPDAYRLMLGSSVVVSSLMATFLNLLLPKQ